MPGAADNARCWRLFLLPESTELFPFPPLAPLTSTAAVGKITGWTKIAYLLLKIESWGLIWTEWHEGVAWVALVWQGALVTLL